MNLCGLDEWLLDVLGSLGIPAHGCLIFILRVAEDDALEAVEEVDEAGEAGIEEEPPKEEEAAADAAEFCCGAWFVAVPPPTAASLATTAFGGWSVTGLAAGKVAFDSPLLLLLLLLADLLATGSAAAGDPASVAAATLSGADMAVSLAVPAAIRPHYPLSTKSRYSLLGTNTVIFFLHALKAAG